MNEPMTTNESSLHDLRHFLKLASAQLRHKLKTAATEGAEPAGIRRMRILEELLKEQTPDENTRPAAGKAR